MSKPSLKPVLLVLLLCALLPACSLLGSKPQASMHIYALEAEAVAAAATAVPNTAVRPANAAAQPVLLVEVPSAAAGYDSNRMVYVRQPQTLEAFTQSNWVDTPARMLAPLIVAAVEGSGVFRAVMTSPSTAAGEMRLDTEVLRLQHEFLGTPSQVRFTLRAYLVESATRRVMATQEFDTAVPADSEDPHGGVVAANRAVRIVLADLSTFCAETARNRR